jgi:hypothetical protein
MPRFLSGVKMYFIKYHPIKRQLRERSLTDREGLPYYLIFMAASAFATTLPVDVSQNQDVYLSALLMFITTIVGVIYCYSMNGGKNGYDFIQKSIVLGFIVFVRCVLPFIAIFVLFYLLKGVLEGVLGYSVGTQSLTTHLFNILIEAFYYWRLGKHIQETRLDFSKKPAAQERFASCDP